MQISHEKCLACYSSHRSLKWRWRICAALTHSSVSLITNLLLNASPPKCRSTAPWQITIAFQAVIIYSLLIHSLIILLNEFMGNWICVANRALQIKIICGDANAKTSSREKIYEAFDLSGIKFPAVDTEKRFSATMRSRLERHFYCTANCISRERAVNESINVKVFYDDWKLLEPEKRF